MTKSGTINRRLKKAMALFTVLPATAIPTAIAAQDIRVGDPGIRVGKRAIRINNARLNIRVQPRLSIRVNSIRKQDNPIGIRVLTPKYVEPEK